jgi:hypothetical protein
MSAGRYAFLGFKVIVLAIGLTISFMIGSVVSGLGRPAASSGAAVASAPAAQPDPTAVLLLLFISGLIQALVVTYLVLEARWRGWRIAAALFLVFFNTFVQAAIESSVYLRGKVPVQFNAQMLVTGLIIGLLFAPFAVWVLGGWGRRPATPRVEYARWSPGEWVGKIAALAVIVLAVYYLCGYYIAWQSPAVRQYYAGSTELKSFWRHMGGIWSAMPWMFPLQAARGLLWVAMTLPAIWMLRGSRARVALGGALMYAALGGSTMLILPNPLMPPAVAHAHLIETTISSLVLGAFVGWTMARHEVPPATEVHTLQAA